MYIPLDYYRILGLPIQATTDQLRQAHRDRTAQLPRREYSDRAIAARKAILDKAYAVLSDATLRQEYDATFLAQTYEMASVGGGDDAAEPEPTPPPAPSEPRNPGIEVEDANFVGALLLLQELGEYELVLRLGRPFLAGGDADLRDGRYGDPALIYADIVLMVSLSCLELGREQWQQGQYENAAEALDTGQKLLLREGLFAQVRGEIQSDLYRLRPYRVLELLSREAADVAQRHQGIELLTEMLDERGGIDGTGDDQSGLNVDDFLRFIQQLRSYMTAAEQQVLFEEEAKRPSAVATYLAVYALIARGFAEHQPMLIRRGHQLLQTLRDRQDVHLEQAVCTLLLGQPEAANQSLEQSQEVEPIAFIRQQSQGAPDLLPGLCLYTERWLQDEVFPHFRDLAHQPISLKDYFADAQVQTYLEDLPNEPEVDAAWTVQSERAAAKARSPEMAAVAAGAAAAPAGDSEAEALVEVARARVAENAGTPAMLGATVGRGDRATATVPTAERVALEDNGANGGGTATQTRPRPGGGGDGRPPQTAARSPRANASTHRARSSGSAPRSDLSRRSRRSNWLVPVGILVGVGVVIGGGIWAVQAWRSRQQIDQPAATTQSVPMLEPGLTPMPTLVEGGLMSAAVLNELAAARVLETWLNAKAAALGANHDTTQLVVVLTEPKLREWTRYAEEAQRDNWHKDYEHQITVESVEQASPDAQEAAVVANVVEKSQYYKGGELKDSNEDNLRVRYQLVRDGDQWKIRSWQVL